MHHTIVLKYLEDYAKHYNIVPHIRFQTKVLLVEPLDETSENSRWCRWSVKYQQNGCQEQQEEFDAVVVCNGFVYAPSTSLFEFCIPEIPFSLAFLFSF